MGFHLLFCGAGIPRAEQLEQPASGADDHAVGGWTHRIYEFPDKSGATQEKYVTVIAQPDFNGDPQLRFQSVTDQKHLDITPRMKLIDAVDTDGDNRAELIFELMRASDRQFAIYKIKGLQAEQAFATEPLPYITPGHAVETSSN